MIADERQAKLDAALEEARRFDAVVAERARERDEARGMVKERDGWLASVREESKAAVAELAVQRDEARRIADERQQKLEFALTEMEKATGIVVDLTRDRDVSRAALRERDANIAKLEAAVAERLKERDEARRIADERQARLEAAIPRRKTFANNISARSEQAGGGMVEARDATIAERLKERDGLGGW